MELSVVRYQLPFRAALLLAALLLTAGCGAPATEGRSSGRAYEVLLVDDAGEVRAALEADAEGLPQGEPAFDVSEARSGQMDARTRMARTIVTVVVDSTAERTSIRYAKNVYARPQMVVTVCTPSRQRLRQDRARWAPLLRQLLTRHEMNMALGHLRQSHNGQAEETVGRRLQASMAVPAELKASKEAEGFVWFSDNGVQTMRNICVYSYPLGRDFATMRDSVMRQNIRGETDSAWMATTPGSLHEERHTEGGVAATVYRGLWEMRGDAMGGPFVARAIADSARRRMVVAEAFVYAPGSNKRNLMRQAEAALYTLRANKKVKK